ncbi:hypothetical protein ZYGR_0AF01020 [Zygosaccharomyces rouxii]|uniref:Uncharacterized protein n=1 Tax=Zygosaccharomyces rouxii TaxID=4956 RepID=A0A1Q3A7I8_ZYGRO|nr:hypothetical protein ZYGR_0AF01020 [Zygosaccharomyces rouxii]
MSQLDYDPFRENWDEINEDWLENSNDASRKHFEMSCASLKNPERSGDFHQKTSQSRTALKTSDQNRQYVSRELPLEFKRSRSARALKGADNRNRGDKIRSFEEINESRDGSTCGEHEELNEKNFIYSVTFSSFLSSIFSNSIFENPPKEYTLSVNPFIENDVSKVLDQLDGVNVNHSHITAKNHSLYSCFLMRFIETRRKASAAVKEAARMAALRCKMRKVIRINAEAVVSRVCTRKHYLSGGDKEELKGRSQDEMNIVKNYGLSSASITEEANSFAKIGYPLEVSKGNSAFEPMTDACWELNDGFCPHVEALINNSNDSDINDHRVRTGDTQPCSWVAVLVSQIEGSGTKSPPMDCWDSQLKPDKLQEVSSHVEASAPIEEANHLSEDNGDKVVNLSSRFTGDDESNAFYCSYLSNQSFDEVHKHGNLFPGTPTPIVGAEKGLYRNNLSFVDNINSVSPNLNGAGSWIDNSEQNKSVESSLTYSRRNHWIPIIDKGVGWNIKDEIVRPQTPISRIPIDEFCNGNSCDTSNMRSQVDDLMSGEEQPMNQGKFNDCRMSLFWFDSKEGSFCEEPEVISIDVNDANCRKHAGSQVDRTISIFESNSFCRFKDNSRNSMELAASSQDMCFFNQMDSKAISSDFDYAFGCRNSSQRSLSFGSEKPGENYSDEFFKLGFYAGPSSGSPTKSFLRTQQRHLCDKQLHPCSRFTKMTSDQFDRGGEGQSVLSPHSKQTELVCKEGRSSSIADLEYFVNIDYETPLDAEVDLDVEFGSWINALTSRIQPLDPNKDSLSNSDSYLSLREDLHRSNSLHHDGVAFPDQYDITLQDSSTRVPHNGRFDCNRPDERSTISNVSPYISGPHSWAFSKIVSGTKSQSSWDVFSRLDALNTRIEGLFFSVDTALSKSCRFEPLTVSVKETGNVDEKLIFSKHLSSDISEDNRIYGESVLTSSSGRTSNKEAIDI